VCLNSETLILSVIQKTYFKLKIFLKRAKSLKRRNERSRVIITVRDRPIAAYRRPSHYHYRHHGPDRRRRTPVESGRRARFD